MTKNKIYKDHIKSDRAYQATQGASLHLPLLEAYVSAGFPSQAENHIEKALDLNELLIHHPAATFFIKVSGDSMIDAGIKSNDILIVDRALTATHNKIVVVRINNELTVKRLYHVDTKILLVPENKHYKPIEITPEMDCEVWGVVTHVIHSV